MLLYQSSGSSRPRLNSNDFQPVHEIYWSAMRQQLYIRLSLGVASNSITGITLPSKSFCWHWFILNLYRWFFRIFHFWISKKFFEPDKDIWHAKKPHKTIADSSIWLKSTYMLTQQYKITPTGITKLAEDQGSITFYRISGQTFGGYSNFSFVLLKIHWFVYFERQLKKSWTEN